jgi:mannan endo-1,4-beta-mannosidase
MQIAKQMGATVIRAWAFLDVADRAADSVAFQYLSHGAVTFDDGPNGLERLDALIHAADELGIRLILPLVNHWGDFGGAPIYLRWLGIEADVSNFYRLAAPRALYRNWLEHLLTRRNTVTGRLYADEPSILAWELANEPRCEVKGGRDILLGWISEMAAFVKQLDSNHLLAVGDEGYFHGRHGLDFEAALDIDQIDFGTYHFYPQNWGYAKRLKFGDKWIKEHIDAGNRANKPVLLEEYGLKIDGHAVKSPQVRDKWFAGWLQCVHVNRGAGDLIWMLGGNEADTRGYRDDYTILSPDEAPALALHALEMKQSASGLFKTRE